MSEFSVALVVVAGGLLWLLWHRVMRMLERHGLDVWGGRGLYRLDGFNRLFARRFHRLRHDPLPLPANGGAVLVCNHISGLDPFLLGAAVPRPLRFLVAREQYERAGMRWFFKSTGCIPVDRSTRPERAFRAALDALSRGEVIGVFPQGGIQEPGDRTTALKGGAVRMAQLAGVPVVPVYLSGVAGTGLVMGALFKRSHAHIQSYAPLDCTERDSKACLAVLSALLSGAPAQVDCPGYDPCADWTDDQRAAVIEPVA